MSDGKTSRDVHRFTNVPLGVKIFFQIGELFGCGVVVADFEPEFDSDDDDSGKEEDLQSHTERKTKSETFSSIKKRASEWLVRNPELNFGYAQKPIFGLEVCRRLINDL